MMNRTAVALLASILAQAIPDAPQTPAEELRRGIEQWEEGRFPEAAITLDAAAEHLVRARAAAREIARARVYLAAVQLGLHQDAKAADSMRSAVATDVSVEVGLREFPPAVVRLYQEARAGLEPKSATLPQTSAPAGVVATKKRGGKALPVLLGAAAAAGGVAVATAGGGKPASPPTASTTPSPKPAPAPTPAPTPTPTPTPSPTPVPTQLRSFSFELARNTLRWESDPLDRVGTGVMVVHARIDEAYKSTASPTTAIFIDSSTTGIVFGSEGRLSNGDLESQFQVQSGVTYRIGIAVARSWDSEANSLRGTIWAKYPAE